MNLVFLGLSITSAWGNGHATNYRALLRALAARGHNCTFLERNTPWYADNRDMPRPKFAQVRIYSSLAQLRARHAALVRDADAVIVGSYVPGGVEVGRWVQSTARGVKAFYDIDTPVTLAKLERADHEYLSPDLIPGYDVYLSFTGGPTLRRIERTYGSPHARAFYCLVDPDLYSPADTRPSIDLGYLGTYSLDRQPALDELLVEPARRAPALRFTVAGPQYPKRIRWPRNVLRIEHLPPRKHRAFYTSQRFTLNITRADMVRAGYSPSVRLFEAAACATPIISDVWPGIETILRPDEEILLARSADEVLDILKNTDDTTRRAIGERARRRVLREHTAEHRAEELEEHLAEAKRRRAPAAPVLLATARTAATNGKHAPHASTKANTNGRPISGQHARGRAEPAPTPRRRQTIGRGTR